MNMTNVIFGIKGEEISLVMEEKKAKDLFLEITGVAVIDDTNNGNNYGNNCGGNNDIYDIKNEKIKHPTLKQLIDLFKNNIDSEISSRLIKDTFYPNYRGSWGRIIENIYTKIQKALQIVELSENGKFEKRRDGKYVIYSFRKINNTLDKWIY